jgi:hypothetical protein
LATPVSLSTLIQRVRQRSNLEGATLFITDPELIDSINASISAWWDLVRLSTWGGQYARVPYTITTTPAISSYALPPNLASIISVDAFVSTGVPIACYAYQEEQRNWLKLAALFGWSSWGVPIYYQLQGGNINFAPTPNGTVSVTLNYVPTAPQLSDYDDTLNSINGWEEWIVLDVAIKCLIKDGQLDIVPMLMNHKQEQTARIQAAAPQADMNQSEGVHETGRWSAYGSGWGRW